MTISIRRATPSDTRAIVDFNLAMARESEARELDPALLEAGVQHMLRQPSEGFYLVAEIDGKVVAALMVTYEWSDWRNGRFWWIQSVYVLPHFRRGGVYSQLHSWVRDAALADGNACGIRLYVEKRNAGAQATYRALGMRVTDYDLYAEEFDRGCSSAITL